MNKTKIDRRPQSLPAVLAILCAVLSYATPFCTAQGDEVSQEPPAERVRLDAAAKKATARGRALYDADKFNEAIPHFDQALKLMAQAA